MTVTSVTNTATTVVGAVQDDPNSMSSTDFMHLLVTELQNQDPLEPMSTTEMSTQLTQMTMNEQLTEMNATLEENLLMSQSINNTSMLALVGHDVTVAGDEVHVTDGEVSGSMLNCESNGTAEVVILDADGAEVASYTVDVEAGLNDISWDGTDPGGDALDDGQYTVQVTVTNPDGDDVSADILMTGAVGGLRYDSGAAIVNVFGTDYYVSDIYQIS